jgi:hypothetical protein
MVHENQHLPCARGFNTSTVSLTVVGADKMRTPCLAYKLTSLPLGNRSAGTHSPGLKVDARLPIWQISLTDIALAKYEEGQAGCSVKVHGSLRKGCFVTDYYDGN